MGGPPWMGLFCRSDSPLPACLLCLLFSVLRSLLPFAFCPRFLVVNGKGFWGLTPLDYAQVQSCIIFKRPKLETTQLSFHVSLDKLWYSYTKAYKRAMKMNLTFLLFSAWVWEKPHFNPLIKIKEQRKITKCRVPLTQSSRIGKMKS